MQDQHLNLPSSDLHAMVERLGALPVLRHEGDIVQLARAFVLEHPDSPISMYLSVEDGNLVEWNYLRLLSNLARAIVGEKLLASPHTRGNAMPEEEEFGRTLDIAILRPTGIEPQQLSFWIPMLGWLCGIPSLMCNLYLLQGEHSARAMVMPLQISRNSLFLDQPYDRPLYKWMRLNSGSAHLVGRWRSGGYIDVYDLPYTPGDLCSAVIGLARHHAGDRMLDCLILDEDQMPLSDKNLRITAAVQEVLQPYGVRVMTMKLLA